MGFHKLQHFLTLKSTILKSEKAQEYFSNTSSKSLPPFTLSHSSSLCNDFDLGDCSRLIGECQSVILRYECKTHKLNLLNSECALSSQFIDQVLYKLHQPYDGDEEPWYRSKQEALSCLIEYFSSPTGRSVIGNWKPVR